MCIAACLFQTTVCLLLKAIRSFRCNHQLCRQNQPNPSRHP